MSDKESPVSTDELKGVKLKEVTAEAQKAEMKLALKCEQCNKIVDWPSHCGELMSLESDKVVCADGCGESAPVPECCNQPTKPFLVKA